MKTKKLIVIVSSVLFMIFLSWYFFIKESDYCITFKVKTATGTIFQGINDWTAEQSKGNKEKYRLVEKRNFDFIKQEMVKGNSLCQYTWNMESLNDSISEVSVGVKELNHSFYNRVTAPFIATKFRTEQIEKVKNFKIGLEDHIANFNIKIIGEGSSKETFVAYINLKSVMQEKAQTMIANDPLITGFLYQNNIKIIGRPYVEINSWDHDKESLDFNYCFPIDKNTKCINNPNVKFKKLPVKKGLKAIYFGNFRTSDRAWFALLDYAKKKGYDLDYKPLELFLDNPFNGGNELEWKTEIIIPFKT
jgi:effector-binding domain-containing protein